VEAQAGGGGPSGGITTIGSTGRPAVGAYPSGRAQGHPCRPPPAPHATPTWRSKGPIGKPVWRYPDQHGGTARPNDAIARASRFHLLFLGARSSFFLSLSVPPSSPPSPPSLRGSPRASTTRAYVSALEDASSKSSIQRFYAKIFAIPICP